MTESTRISEINEFITKITSRPTVSVIFNGFYNRNSYRELKIIILKTIYTIRFLNSHHKRIFSETPKNIYIYNIPAPLAWTTLSGIRSLSKRAMDSMKLISCNKIGPFGPAVSTELTLSTGAPNPLVIFSLPWI